MNLLQDPLLPLHMTVWALTFIGGIAVSIQMHKSFVKQTLFTFLLTFSMFFLFVSLFTQTLLFFEHSKEDRLMYMRITDIFQVTGSFLNLLALFLRFHLLLPAINFPLFRYPLFKRFYRIFNSQSYIFAGILGLIYFRFLISTIAKLLDYYGMPPLLDASSVVPYTITALVLDLYCNWKIYFLIRAHERSGNSENTGLSFRTMLFLLILQMLIFAGALTITFTINWKRVLFAMNYNLYIFYSYPEVVYLIIIRNLVSHQPSHTASYSPL